MRSRCVGADIDSPWLFDDGNLLCVNGVDVVPLVEAELNRAFPAAPIGAPEIRMVCAAWARLESTWAATLVRDLDAIEAKSDA